MTILITALSALAISAQCSEAETKALEKLDRDWAKYGDTGNRAELEKIYADDFRAIGYLEVGGNKKETIDNTLNNTGSSAAQPETTYDNYVITCTPNTATITHRNTNRVMSGSGGKEYVNYSRSVHFLEKRGGRWQVVSMTGHAMADDSAVVMNTEIDGYKAYMRRDMDWFKNHTADNYIGTSMDGKTHNKMQMLEVIANDKNKYDSVKLTDAGVRVEGDMAVMTGVYDVKGQAADGKPMNMKMRFTRTLVKKDGRWQAVAGQTTAVTGN